MCTLREISSRSVYKVKVYFVLCWFSGFVWGFFLFGFILFFSPLYKLFGDKSVSGNVHAFEDTLQAARKIHQSHYLL